MPLRPQALLGLNVEPLSMEYRARLHSPAQVGGGVVVIGVVEGSAADEAGLRLYDVLTAWDAHPLPDPAALAARLGAAVAGQRVVLSGWRAQTAHTWSVVLRPLPTSPKIR